MPSPRGRESTGQRLGDFEIVREIGRGGMGVVYEARQVSLNRTVALKLLSGGLGLTPRAVQRFRREAEAAAKLHHTNIVPVYATGEEAGIHFYAMELIDGPSLDQVIRQMRQGASGTAATVTASGAGAARPPDLAQTGPYVEAPTASGPTPEPGSSSLGSGSGYFDTVAGLIADVADALEHAHRLGVIHRDIKPANLLLSSAGRLSVNDFGLARLLEQPGMTMTGEFVGTPAYMSPEQIAAGRIPLDHRTDIYSLGATLYELLTLQRPFAGERRDQVLAQIAQKEPRAPRKVNPQVPRDLETICLKALEKDPDRRYQTATALAEDLRRYVNRFAISARRAGPVERLRKWVKRHPAVAASLAGVALAVGLAGFFAYQACVAEGLRRAEQRRHDEELQTERRQRAIDDAIAAALAGDLGRAERAIGAAELHGASTGQVRLLRGLVHFHGRDVRPAIEDLEQAARLLPSSVAVRALLAIFYYRLFEMAKIEQLVEDLGRLEAVTPKDFLFLGYLQSVFDPDLAVRTLDEAVRRRDTAVARAIRAEVRAHYALERADPSMAAGAQEDARVARGLLPDNPFALSASAQAHLVAAVLHREGGTQSNRQSALAEMERDVRELERFDQYPGVAFCRSLYYAQIGDEAAATEALRRAADRPADNPVLVAYAADCYRRGETEKALEVLARRKDQGDWGGNLLRAYLLAERPNGGPAQAYEAVREWMGRYGTAENVGLGATALLVLGRKAEAQSYVRGQSAPGRQLGPKRQDFSERYRAYASGEDPSEEALLRAARGLRSQRCRAHFLIGMTHLADGDRGGAKYHLRQADANRCYNLFIEYLSLALLARLDNDPAWPPWIPTKK
jgi:serine/threonine protein kinase